MNWKKYIKNGMDYELSFKLNPETIPEVLDFLKGEPRERMITYLENAEYYKNLPSVETTSLPERKIIYNIPNETKPIKYDKERIEWLYEEYKRKDRVLTNEMIVVELYAIMEENPQLIKYIKKIFGDEIL